MCYKEFNMGFMDDLSKSAKKYVGLGMVAIGAGGVSGMAQAKNVDPVPTNGTAVHATLDAKMAELDRDVSTLQAAGVTHATIHSDSHSVTINGSANASGVLSADAQGNLEGGAGSQMKGQNWYDMNDKVEEHNVTAHSINKDVREYMAAKQCGMDVSEGNLFNTMSQEEVVAIYGHMKNLEPEHTLDVNVLKQFGQAMCDGQATPEQIEKIQTQLEVKQGERFAEAHNLDVQDVNIDYEVEM